MGGGTSNLFYGTKGAQKEYQYTFFQDERTGNSTGQVNFVSEGAVSGIPTKTVRKQKISVDAVSKKCHDYYDGKLGAQQFTNWLRHITSEPIYEMEDKLRLLIETMLQKFDQFLKKNRRNTMEEFNLLVHDFEIRLHQLP